MNSLLKIAVMLTAYDQMSREVRSAVNKSKKELSDLKAHATAQFAQGFGLMGAGATGFAAVGKTVAAYADLEDAALSLKSVMMQDGGIIDPELFEKTTKLAEGLGDKLPGTTMDFYNMFSTMIRAGIPAKNIVDGVGVSAANLAVALKLPYEEAGKLAAKLKEATGIADNEMLQFMDTIARTNQVGVEASEMQFAFSRSAGALRNMRIQGLEASKSISAVYAMLIKSGASGETVGTGMTAVLNSFMNAEKMDALNQAAGKFGITMDFVDKKTGEFKGVENMMVQFDKLKGLNSSQRAGIIQAFLGPGADANFMTILASKGVEGYNQMTKAMSTQATLNDKVQMQLGGLKNKWEAATGTFVNLLASLGEKVAPALGEVVDMLGAAAAATRQFVDNNPRLAKFIVLLATFVSAALMLAGVIKIIQGVVAIFKVLNLVMAMNPFILIALAVVVVAALIFTYWDKIKIFFINLWEAIKAGFFKAIQWIKILLMAVFVPWLLIYQHWDKLKPYFLKLWSKVKEIFTGFVGWVKNIGVEFFNAGRNIATQIWQGIKAMAHKPVEAVKDMVQKCRDLLPFSPAKTGPFKDLHKIKIVETIAASIKASPMVQAMSRVVAQAVGVPAPVSSGSSVGGGITLHYAPVVNIGAGANKADFMAILQEHKDEILRLLNTAAANKARTKF
jgi:TP901 family phage tail tape measure protein